MLVLWRCLAIQQSCTRDTRPLSPSSPTVLKLAGCFALKKADLKVKITFCDANYDNRFVQTLESSSDRGIYANYAFDKALQLSIVCLDCFKVLLHDDGRTFKR